MSHVSVCCVCGQHACYAALKDPYGKSGEFLLYCGKHGPGAAIHPFSAQKTVKRCSCGQTWEEHKGHYDNAPAEHTHWKHGPFCPITGNPCLTDTWDLNNPPDCSCGRMVRDHMSRSEH